MSRKLILALSAAPVLGLFMMAVALGSSGANPTEVSAFQVAEATSTKTPRPDVDGLLATHSCHQGDPRLLQVGQSTTCMVRVQNRNEENVTNVTSFVFNRKGYDVPTLPQEIVNIRIYGANGQRLDPVAEAAAIDGDTADIPANGYALYITEFTKTSATQSISRNRYACAIDDGVIQTAYCSQGNNS